MAEDESLPQTQPYTPVFDTGAQPQAAGERSTADSTGPAPPAQPDAERADPPTGPLTAPHAATTTDDAPPLEPIPVPAVAPESAPPSAATPTESVPTAPPPPPPAQPVTVPSRYQYLKWWKLLLVVAGVWIVAAAIGLGLFSWWYHAPNKTPADFVVLVYVVVCTVGALMLAMVPGRPLLAALAVAVMSALFASAAAAAPLYGYYYCQRMPHCLAGIIPY